MFENRCCRPVCRRSVFPSPPHLPLLTCSARWRGVQSQHKHRDSMCSGQQWRTDFLNCPPPCLSSAAPLHSTQERSDRTHQTTVNSYSFTYIWSACQLQIHTIVRFIMLPAPLSTNTTYYRYDFSICLHCQLEYISIVQFKITNDFRPCK